MSQVPQIPAGLIEQLNGGLRGPDLRAARMLVGLSQSDIAKVTGVTRDAVTQWERSDWVPRARVGVLRELLRKPLAYLAYHQDYESHTPSQEDYASWSWEQEQKDEQSTRASEEFLPGVSDAALLAELQRRLTRTAAADEAAVDQVVALLRATGVGGDNPAAAARAALARLAGG